MNKRLIALACVAFGVAELLLVILSWLLSATRLEGVRSLISSEGIRWFVGEFTYTLASPLLVWLLLVLVALGCLQRSGLMSRGRGYRDRVALRVSLSFMIIYVVIICLLTLMPHAILLSVTGSLFPSAFSRALVPIICFGVGVLSISFGMVSGRLHTLTDILDALTFGLQQGAPLIILYIMFFQFYASLLFVFG
ncbi:MAG: ABC transporter substrate-binding protein [Prevotella sp.]|nr:ABC transporter substrate-binding protein [Prevotella sp.]